MSFDALAPHYRWMEWLLAGGKLHRCRAAFLSELQNSRNVLLLGEGNGRFLDDFVRVNDRAHVTVLDGSEGMLRAAKQRLCKRCVLPEARRVEFVHTDIFDWEPDSQCYDLIVTNFFLDCFRPEQLRELVPRLARSAGENAQWIVSDFRIPDRGLKRWRAKWIVGAMYCFFRVATGLPASRLTSVDSLLRDAGFHLQDRHITEWGLLHSDFWVRTDSQTQPTHATTAREFVTGP